MRSNMRKMGLLLATMYIVVTQAVYADEPNYWPRDYSIVPTTPGVAQFLNFQSFKVDNFRGIPQIIFPIYEIKAGAITVPIVLSYHGGGIRTTQACGNAGMGWTLSFGAEIGHTVNGAPDDAYKPAAGQDKIHGLYRLNDIERSFRTKLINKAYTEGPDINDPSLYEQWQGEEGQRYYNGLTDLANDTYNLYGLGLSAVFAYDDTRHIIKSAERPIIIQHSSQLPYVHDGGCDAYGYEVFSQSGIKYLFLTQDRCRYDYSYGSPQLTQQQDSVYYASAWHLDEISDLNGNKITYHYHEAPRYTKDMGNSVYRYYATKQEQMQNKNRLASVNSVIYRPQILDSICYDGITVKIEYLHQTTSNRSVPLIKGLKIFAEGAVQREIQFNYENYSSKYLSTVVDQGETILSFDYYDPEENNFYFYYDSQDFGGYNNGIDNDSNLIPTVGAFGLGANRSVVPDMAKKGVLTKITYPTGGTTEFDWESNDFNYVGPHTNTAPALSDTPYSKIEVDTLRMCLDAAYQKTKLTDWRIFKRQEVSIDLTKYYNMNPANLFGTDYWHTHDYGEYYSYQNPPNFPHVRFVKVNKTNGNRDVARVFYLDKRTIEDNGKNLPITFQLDSGFYDVELINPLSVQNSYDFLNINMMFGDSPSGRIYLSRKTQDIIGHQSRDLWCGLRIRRITSSTGDPDDTPIRKDYFYNKNWEPNRTSGTINYFPRFAYQYYEWYSLMDGGVGYSDCQVVCIGSTAFPTSPMGDISQIQYPEVSTRLSQPDRYDPHSYLNNYAETFRYSSARNPEYNDLNNTPNITYQPVGARVFTSKSHMRGDLLSSTVSSGSYGIGTTSTYGYNIYEKTDVPLLATDAFVLCDYSKAPGINPYAMPNYCIGTYQIIPYTKAISFEHTEESDGIMTSKDYQYYYNTYSDNLDYNLPKSVSTKTSEEHTLTTHFIYPRKGKFCLSQPEVEIAIEGNTVLSAKRTEFNPITLLPVRTYELSQPIDTGLILPHSKEVGTAQINAINSPLFEYKYNSHGNLIEIIYKGKALVSYIWGYNGLYPIIEALNTPYAVLQNAALNSGLTLNQINGQAVTTQTELNNLATQLRANLPDAEITSMAYHWIWGVVEMTDGRGVSSKFNYDQRGRLTEIRDFNNYLISKFDYHYQNYIE